LQVSLDRTSERQNECHERNRRSGDPEAPHVEHLVVR